MLAYNNDERDLDNLLYLLNRDNPNLINLQQIKQDVEYIFSNFHQKMTNYKIDPNFTEFVKANIRNKNINDKIIIMMMVNKLLFHYVPRKIQIISLLLMIYNTKPSGLIE